MTPTTQSYSSTTTAAYKPFSAVVGVAALVVLLQGVWAGVFIREGHDNNASWVTVHARGADVAVVLGIIGAVMAVVKLRGRRDLLIGSIVFAVLLIVEAYIGGLVGNNPAVQEIHFPLGMALVGLAVWLPLRARRTA